MGFTVEEVTSGVERVLEQLKYADVKRESVGGVVRLSCRGDELHIEIAPMPAERIPKPSMFPRTWLVLRAEPTLLQSLHRKILYAFLRVGG